MTGVEHSDTIALLREQNAMGLFAEAAPRPYAAEDVEIVPTASDSSTSIVSVATEDAPADECPHPRCTARVPMDCGWIKGVVPGGQPAGCHAVIEDVVPEPAVAAPEKPQPETAVPVPQPAVPLDQLLEEIVRFLSRYVVLPGNHEAVAIGLFVAHTYALDAAHCTPYLVVLSPERRSGKTLLLELLELLVRRPWRIVAASESAMFRKITQDRPTLLLDEIDAVFGSASERTEPLRAILNAGNRPGASVARCVGDGGRQSVVDFSVFCPKLLAGIDTGRLPDTIRDRGIELRMKRKTAVEHVERFRLRLVRPDAEAIRAELERWADAATDTLRAAEPHLPGSLHDRLAEAWEPLLAIADMAGGQWPARARAAAVALAVDEPDDASYGTRLLAKLATLLRDRSVVATDDLLAEINADEELPFGGWRDGRGIDSRTLAKLLRPYGVKPRTVRLDDGRTPKGYRLDETAEEAFSRYTSQEAPQAPQAPQATEPPHVTPHEYRVVADVADVAANPQGVADRLFVADNDGREITVTRELLDAPLVARGAYRYLLGLPASAGVVREAA